MTSEHLLGHVENLAPGFATILVIGTRIPATTTVFPNPLVASVFKEPFVAALLLTAAAYLVGTAVFIVSRWPIDTLSAVTLRPLFLKLYRWKDFPKFNPLEINRAYRRAIDAVLKKEAGNPIRAEVSRRRQRGRLLRSAYLPLVIWLWPYFTSVADFAFATLVVVAIYAYAEVTIYQEARLAT